MSSEEKERAAAPRMFAAIDIGSHTTRMLIAVKEGSNISPVRAERRVTRLARGFQGSWELAPAAEGRNLSALREYATVLSGQGIERIACGATGVVRRARNSGAVLDRIARETGIRVEVLSEDAEAVLSAKGILSVLPRCGGNILAFDIGGGSTEFSLVTRGGLRPAWTSSRPVGAATLTEKYLACDPPGTAALEHATVSARMEILAAREHMHANLAQNGIMKFQDPILLAGTAGTVTTLAAMHLGMTRYEPYRINGVELTAGWVASLVESLARASLEERKRIPGLEPGREDIILGGAVIVGQILACFGAERFTATDAGLLEGLLLDLVEREFSLPRGLTTGLTWRPQKG